MRRLASVLVFPLVLGGGVALASFGLGAKWSPALLVSGVSLLGAVAILLGERWLPFAAAWSEARGDVLVDATHTVVSMGLATPARLSLRGRPRATGGSRPARRGRRRA